MEDGWMTAFEVVGPPPVRSINVYGTINGDRRLMYAAKWKSSLGQNGGVCDDGSMVIERNRKFGCPPANKPISIDIEVETQDCVCSIFDEKDGTPKLCWGTLLADATVTETKPLTPPFTGTAPQINVTMMMLVQNHEVPDATVTLQGKWDQPSVSGIAFNPPESKYTAGGLLQIQDFLDQGVSRYLSGSFTGEALDCSAGIIKLESNFMASIASSTAYETGTRVAAEFRPFGWTLGATVGLYVSDAIKCGSDYRGRTVEIGISSAEVIPNDASCLYDDSKIEGEIVMEVVHSPTVSLDLLFLPPEPPWKPKGSYSTADVIDASISGWERRDFNGRGNLSYLASVSTKFTLTVS
jgi:hypothetical protein